MTGRLCSADHAYQQAAIENIRFVVQTLLVHVFIHECTKHFTRRKVYKAKTQGIELNYGTPTVFIIDQIKFAIDQ